jgi:hypothetical protein
LRSVPCCRGHPEQTALDHVVRQQLETCIARASGNGWKGQRLPVDLEHEFRRYLERGILAYEFARAGHTDCKYDFPVSFSCKATGRWQNQRPVCLMDQTLPSKR